uniref:G domain-containing protein n=1 Tax=Ascaris suum TaxID=6253 RepID=F1KRS0_ASCSU
MRIASGWSNMEVSIRQSQHQIGVAMDVVRNSTARMHRCLASCRSRSSQNLNRRKVLSGFLPVEIFSKLESTKGPEEGLCRRCYLLEKHNFLLNVNVCEVDYRSMMCHLKLKQEALIILVVDMSDLPASIYAHLPEIIGDRKPMVVVGNKVDLLPPDQRSGYLKHFRETLFKAVEDVGFTRRFNVLHVALISAKTGFGVEELITNIHLKWSTRGTAIRNDIYLVGCTNAGKSTLFNTLLQSDLCKVRAVDLVQRATTSIWPGTTISLLKFPVMNPTPHKLELRRRRLLANQAWALKERRMRKQLLKETGDVKYATLQAYVGNTFKETEEELQPISIKALRNEDVNSTLMEGYRNTEEADAMESRRMRFLQKEIGAMIRRVP